MPFDDTNSLLMTKPYKVNAILKAMNGMVVLRPSLGLVRFFFIYVWMFFYQVSLISCRLAGPSYFYNLMNPIPISKLQKATNYFKKVLSVWTWISEKYLYYQKVSISQISIYCQKDCLTNVWFIITQNKLNSRFIRSQYIKPWYFLPVQANKVFALVKHYIPFDINDNIQTKVLFN